MFSFSHIKNSQNSYLHKGMLTGMGMTNTQSDGDIQENAPYRFQNPRDYTGVEPINADPNGKYDLLTPRSPTNAEKMCVDGTSLKVGDMVRSYDFVHSFGSHWLDKNGNTHNEGYVVINSPSYVFGEVVAIEDVEWCGCGHSHIHIKPLWKSYDGHKSYDMAEMYYPHIGHCGFVKISEAENIGSFLLDGAEI